MWHPEAKFDFHLLFLKKLYLLICLFLAMLGLHCCTGFPLVEVHGLLIVGASFVAEYGLRLYQLSSCGSRAGEPKVNGCATPTRLLALSRVGSSQTRECLLHWQVDSLPFSHQGIPDSHFLTEDFMFCYHFFPAPPPRLQYKHYYYLPSRKWEKIQILVILSQ